MLASAPVLSAVNFALGAGTTVFLVALVAYGALVAGRHANRLAEKVGARRALNVALAVAAAGVVVSLYYSEIAGYEPCLLCWWQRIAMYPIALLLAVAAFRRDQRHVLPYVASLAWAGLALGLFHVNLQAGGAAANIAGFCGVEEGGGCGVPPFVVFGYVTIPLASAASFGVILAAIDVARRALGPDPRHHDARS